MLTAMTLYTMPLKQAETRLRDLVQRARHNPVGLTGGDSAEPIAFLLDANYFASATDDANVILTARLKKLSALLDLLAANWENTAIKAEFPKSWRWQLEGIWEASTHREQPFRQLTLLLQLAADDLNMAQFTQSHLALWQACIAVLQGEVVHSADLAQCDQALSDAQFPVLLNFGDDLVESYVAES